MYYLIQFFRFLLAALSSAFVSYLAFIIVSAAVAEKSFGWASLSLAVFALSLLTTISSFDRLRIKELDVSLIRAKTEHSKERRLHRRTDPTMTNTDF